MFKIGVDKITQAERKLSGLCLKCGYSVKQPEELNEMRRFAGINPVILTKLCYHCSGASGLYGGGGDR